MLSHLHQMKANRQHPYVQSAHAALRPYCRNLYVQRQNKHFKIFAEEESKNNADVNASPNKEDKNPSTSSELKIAGEEKNLQIDKSVIERLKYTVFGFDTFWVTSVENYESDGIVFKGNLRGQDASIAYNKMRDRLQREMGDQFVLFLVEDQDEKPTAIVLPTSSARDGAISKFTEIWLSVVFLLTTLVTTLNANGVPILEFIFNPVVVPIPDQAFADALPGSVAFWALIACHEFGHWRAAQEAGMKLYLPFVVPAGFGLLGSFGTITRPQGFPKNREDQLAFGVSGPLYGMSASLAMVLLGYALTAGGLGDTQIDTPAFASSLFMAITAQLFVGDQLSEPVMFVHPLLVAGWGGLLVNALNSIPTGELDGGRMAMSLWGRRASGLVGVLTIAAMSFASFGNSLAFAWVLFVVILQRGPLLPCYEEVKVPTNNFNRWAAIVLMTSSLLVLLPYPVELLNAIDNLSSPTLF